MLTAVAAIAALFVAPLLTARASRRERLAASRQTWLDALRTDVAGVLSIWTNVLALREHARLRGEQEPLTTTEMTMRVDQLAWQIRLRLNVSRPDQAKLQDAITEFCCCSELTATSMPRRNVSEAMDVIVQAVWHQIQFDRLPREQSTTREPA
ncbi:hypothetical protein [Sphingomonas sp. GC_Shp_4]|nr:hypothetical protein [Sphingomonas sp. GC_Shp_4]